MFKDGKNIISKVMVCLMLLSMFFVGRESARLVSSMQVLPVEKKVVVIDAGHGGIDPGKIGINNALEKDINLAIAKKLKRYLEQQDVTVMMTREGEEGLYRDSDSNKKVQDMKNRLEIIESAQPNLTVSIHQNSYTQESISGVQVFYYRDSEKGKRAALLMQDTLIQELKPEKEREAKENTSYYLLKKTTVPLLIVECGFLSNSREAALLVNNSYQEKVAWAIHMGVMRFLSEVD